MAAGGDGHAKGYAFVEYENAVRPFMGDWMVALIYFPE